MPDSAQAAGGIVAVVGNPRRGSRTGVAAAEFTAALAGHIDWLPAPLIVDLADIGSGPLGRPSPEVERLLEAVVVAPVAVFATPTYKASYTGLLKLFLDQLPANALCGTVAVPVTVAAAPTHRTAADGQLRPVLAELGASLPVPSFLLEEPELADVPALAERWAGAHAGVVAATAGALRGAVRTAA